MSDNVGKMSGNVGKSKFYTYLFSGKGHFDSFLVNFSCLGYTQLFPDIEEYILYLNLPVCFAKSEPR